MCTDEDCETKTISMVLFYGQDWHVRRFYATTGLQITFTIT